MPGLDTAWSFTQGDSRVRVAVLDGPVDLSHPCFQGADLEVAGSSNSNGTCSGAGPASCGHGTHVASIIFAQHGTGPLRGIAPGCHGILIPVFKDDPRSPGRILPCTQTELAQAINQAREREATLINISGGQLTSHSSASPELVESVRKCVASGILIVSATGNDGCDCIHVPAALPGVLAVGSLSNKGDPSAFSNFGREYESNGILAPGEEVPGAEPGGGVQLRSGTSFATPILTGVAALLASLKLVRTVGPETRSVVSGNGKSGESQAAITVNAAELGDILVATAKPCEADSYQPCRRFLAGTLNTEAAVQYIVRGGHGMKNEQIGGTTSAALPEIASTTTNGGSINAQACGCGGKGLPADGQAAPVQSEDEETEKNARPAIAPGTTRSNGTTKASQATGDRVLPSCECEGAGPLVYVLGEIGYDFVSDARRDSFSVAMNEGQKPGQPPKSPYNPEDLLAFLRSENRYSKAHLTAVTWTVNLEGTPIYALRPDGTFARETYETILEFYDEQIHKQSDRAAFPGTLKEGTTARLLSGQVVPVICPEVRGMANWKTKQIAEAARKEVLRAKRVPVQTGAKRVQPGDERVQSENELDEQLTNFLNRIYFEFRNMGQSPEERAINYSATNVFALVEFIIDKVLAKYQLDTIEVEKSPICRLDSDCWDVKLVFFDTTNFLAPRTVHRTTVDVSDVVPVSVGDPREWQIR